MDLEILDLTVLLLAQVFNQSINFVCLNNWYDN